MGRSVFDRYTWLHMASGVMAAGVFSLSGWTWFWLHALFEIVENTPVGIRYINKYLLWIWPGGKDFADAPINSVGDQISAMVGWWVMTTFYL